MPLLLRRALLGRSLDNTILGLPFILLSNLRQGAAEPMPPACQAGETVVGLADKRWRVRVERREEKELSFLPNQNTSIKPKSR